jgi:hypothetical protein
MNKSNKREPEPSSDNIPSLSSNEHSSSQKSVEMLESLELGDVIMIHAPSNPAIDGQAYYVYYIDHVKLKLLNTSTHQLLKLNIDGYVADESIVAVDLLSRSDVAGFAKQHKLEPPQWVDIHFGGDMPAIISGEITNLEEDMIEITTHPGMRVIYIDFAYKGVPEDLPIEKIVLRERPKALNTSLRSMLEGTSEIGREQAEAEATVEFDENDGQLIVSVPENAAINPTPAEIIEEYINHEAEIPSADGEEDDGELASMRMFFEVPESERRYSEEMQVADLLGELVSKLPTDKRTAQTLKDIHRFVTRFKELRRVFSVFDENGDVIMPKTTNILHKPLIDHIMNLDKRVQWILPVIRERNELMFVGTTNKPNSDKYDSRIVIAKMKEYAQSLEIAQKEFSKSAALGDANKYDTSMKIIEQMQTPAPESDFFRETDDIFLKNVEVKTDIECIVSNDADFNMDSSVSEDRIYHKNATHRFTTRRYSVGSTRMMLEENTRRRMFKRTKITRSDKLNIHSIIMLPRSVLLQSVSSTPSANLHLKSKLSEIPVYKFRILKPNTRLRTKAVENLDAEINYEDAIAPNKKPEEPQEETEPFLKAPTHYALSNDAEVEHNEPNFRKFLNAILPRTRTLIRWMRPSIEHIYSFADVVASLEPFFVESEDITFKQYIEIRYFVKEKIKAYVADVAKHRKDFDAFKAFAKSFTPPVNRIMTIVKEDAEMNDYLLATYKLANDSEKSNNVVVTSSETLNHLLIIDGAATCAATLNMYLIEYLTIPESVVGILKPPTINSDDARTIVKSKCDRRFLTKKYRSVAELRKDDNTTDVFYDKEYDDTPYHLLDTYKNDKKRFKTDAEFLEFFTETLIEKHDCPSYLAPTLANTILSKKKRVNNGEYAMLEIKPTLAAKLREEGDEEEKREVEQEAETRKRIEFYKRTKDEWVLDKTLGLDAFTDTNTLFCELSETCNKITDVNQCVPGEMAALQMRIAKRARMMEEFEDRVARSFEEVTGELQVKLSSSRKQIRRDLVVKKTKLYRQNNYSYELGKYAKSTENVVESPHVDLRERILGWPDFVEKQNMIYTFVSTYCRGAMQQLEEDSHWMYCKDTNTRLFPVSIYDLAWGFITDEYTETLDRILRENGELSDDGDSIVDKYTGYVLRKIDYSAEEGFDESGFRITTNAVVVEKDIGAMVLEVLSKKDRVFDNPTAQSAYNVFRTLSQNMGLENGESSIEEFALRIANEMMNDADVVMSEQAYAEKQAAAAQTKAKTAKMPYTTYYNQLLIIIVSCATFAGMQTLIPSFKTKRTFPGCVKSFAGFPLDAGNAENVGGLKYLACVLDKSKRANTQPWSSIEPLSIDNLLKKMKMVMQNYVYPRPDVFKLYELKRDFLSRHPDTDIPEETAIQRWVHFQPPVVPFAFESGKLPTGISAEYETELFQTVMNGTTEQFKMIGNVRGKLLKHGYLVFDIINRIVGKKQLLLATAGGTAFLENACCNEEGSNINPIKYFCKEIPELTNVLQKARKMEAAMWRVRNLSKAKTFFDPNSSRVIGAAIPDTIISKTIYETFIHYGNFDNDAQIPAYLLPIVSSKPEYNRFASLEEKIAFMKRHGKNYGVGEFHSIMRAVNERNMVNRKLDKEIEALSGWKDMLEYFDEKNSDLVEERLRELVRRTLNEYDPKTAVHEEREPNRKLNKYLKRANERMQEAIVSFLDTHGNLTLGQLDRISTFLETAVNWKIGNVTSATKEICNMVYNLAKVYPKKTVTNRFQTTMPGSWGFSHIHSVYLLTEINAFYRDIAALVDENENSTFNQYLKRAILILTDLVIFVEQVPRFAPFVKEDGLEYWSLYSDDTVLLLHHYALLSAVHEYVVLANDREFAQIRAEEIKSNRRAKSGEDVDMEFEDAADYGADDMVRQVHIVESDTEELKKMAAKWLSAVLDREIATKTAVDKGYKEIMDATMGLKYKDKKGITDYLANLTRDERRVEQTLRSHKIGRWNVGMQKGLYQYEKSVYETEVGQWREGDDEVIVNVPVPVNDDGEGGEEVEDLERAERREQIADYDEGDGIENLNEEYMDGIYYEEDGERENYDEY